MKKQTQMSEAMPTIFFLTLSGGFQDAYTYIERGGVFANAQTGNIVLLSTNLLSGNFDIVLTYIIPILSFVLGIILSEVIRTRFKDSSRIHWRQLVLAIEIVLLFSVGFISSKYNNIANAIVSLSCAMQVEAFRKLEGRAFASTMCIGNLRSGSENLYRFLQTKERNYLITSLYYFGIILTFALGAGIGGILSLNYGLKTIWISPILLSLSLILMFINNNEN